MEAIRIMIRVPSQIFTLVNKSIVRSKPALIQTDGSYSYKTSISRTASILTVNNDEYKYIKTYFDHMNSMESEWASLVDGLEYSQNKGIKSLVLENDCLPIISSIVLSKPPKNPLFLDYYIYFNSLTIRYTWLGIRWIPREMNRADELLMV